MAECPGVLGLKVLFEGTKPCVDIIAVHGLGASPDWAWIRKVKNGDEEVHVNWLADEDMLRAKLPDSRIMTFNYESKWLLGAPKQRRSLCAEQLLTALDNKRKEEKDTEYRPLIFIGHSFGGVVIEQSLVRANSYGGRFQYLALSTVGIIFLGTPHRGTQAAKWGEIVATSAKALGFGFEDSILKDLREDSEHSRDLLYEFTLWANRAPLKVVCFFEQHKTDYGKRFGMAWKELEDLDKVVDEISACIDGYRKVPLPTDHLKINKYSGPHDPSYAAVYPLIVDMAQNAKQIVEGRLDPQEIVKDNSKIPKENFRCLQSLFLSNPQDDLAAIRSAKGDRVPGTCEWILTQNEYTTWVVEDGPQLLWLSGGPGIGKTMISSFLVEELAHLAARSSQMTLAYYFCDDKVEGRRTATAILRGLLLQLLRQRPILFNHIQSHFDMSRDSLFTNFHALWRIFVSIVQDSGAGEVFCLIDALDECEKESRQLFLTDFTKLFCSQPSQKTVIKFIVASRRENDIEESLSAVGPAVQNLQVDSGRVNHDLHEFINVRVDELSKMKGYKSALKEKIRCALTEKAGGTFLYVSLVLHDLKKTIISSQVTQKLRELPSDLNRVYDRILGLIEADCKEIAELVLRWVTVARRPLLIDELAMALVLSTEKWENGTRPPEELLDEMKDGFKCCEPLVYVDTVNHTVNLVHQSAKDYLLSTRLQEKDGLSQYHIVLDRANLLIFRTCWTYLSLKEFEQGTVIIERDRCNRIRTKYPGRRLLDYHCFLPYVSKEWEAHALAAGPALATDHEFWRDDLHSLPTLRDFLLLEAAADGQEMIVQRLLEEGADPNSKDDYDQTPLSRAAEEGHEVVVRLLLSRDDVAADSRDDEGRTPLSWAAEEGHEAVVRLLLSRDDVAADSRDDEGQTPLSWAAERGQEAVIRLLLSRDDVVSDSRDIDGRTPLSWAAKTGQEAVVRLLLSRDDVVPDSRDTSGQTPLSLTAEGGQEAVLRLLLSRDDVVSDSRDIDGRTPLSWAAQKGHEAVVRLLLSRDDVAADSRDDEGQTPLSWAAKTGQEAVVRLLLSRDDVAVDSRDTRGRTPLSWAADAGQEAVVRLLLSRDDVAVDSRDVYGRTLLSWAAQGGQEAVVRLLLSRDDVPDSRDIEGRTPLSWAAERGQEAVVRLLLSRDDVAVDSRDVYGRTPLSWAAQRGHKRTVRLLLNQGDVIADSRDNRGRTPLSWAATEGQEAVVRLLLSRDDVAIESQDDEGRTPLWLANNGGYHARGRGHDAVVELLERMMKYVSYTAHKFNIVDAFE